MTMKANIKLWSTFLLFLGVLSQTTEVSSTKNTTNINYRIAPFRRDQNSSLFRPKPHGEESLKETRVFCLVMTSGRDNRTMARHIKKTWGMRCNNLLFISDSEDNFLPAVTLHKFPTGEPAGLNLKEAFTYVFYNHFDTIDWIVKATDESFLVVENLRHFLSFYDPSEKLYMGYRVKNEQGPGYMHGGPGYVLSRESLRALVEEGFRKLCGENSCFGDAEVGECLNRVGVKMVDTRDSSGRHRFLPRPPSLLLNSWALPSSDSFTRASFYPLETGWQCCSDTWISSPVRPPSVLYLYDFMTHDIRLLPKKHRVPQNKTYDTLYLDSTMYLTANISVKNGRNLIQHNHSNKTYSAEGALSSAIRDLIMRNIQKLHLGDLLSKIRGAPQLKNQTTVLGPSQFNTSGGGRLLCMVMTSSQYHRKRARHIKNTWGRQCTYLIFMSDEKDSSLPAIQITKGSKEGSTSWLGTRTSLKYVYDNYLNKIDWLLQIKDQSYVFVDNLLALVDKYNPDDKVLLGCRLKSSKVKNGYLTSTAGSVWSRGTVRTFVEKALPCQKNDFQNSDIRLMKCLQKSGVKLVDTRDELSRFRFLPLSVEYFMMPGGMSNSTRNWWFSHTYYPTKIGRGCCSSSLVTLNRVSSVNMYLYDFFLYKFKLMTNREGAERRI